MLLFINNRNYFIKSYQLLNDYTTQESKSKNFTKISMDYKIGISLKHFIFFFPFLLSLHFLFYSFLFLFSFPSTHATSQPPPSATLLVTLLEPPYANKLWPSPLANQATYWSSSSSVEPTFFPPPSIMLIYAQGRRQSRTRRGLGPLWNFQKKNYI